MCHHSPNTLTWKAYQAANATAFGLSGPKDLTIINVIKPNTVQ